MNISDLKIPEGWKNVARIADRLESILQEERDKQEEPDVLGRMDILAALLVTLVSYVGQSVTEKPEEFSVMEMAAWSILQKVAFIKRNPEMADEMAAKVLTEFREELKAKRRAASN